MQQPPQKPPTMTGSSRVMLSVTCVARGVALAKLVRYRSAKVSATGSFRSMIVWSSFCRGAGGVNNGGGLLGHFWRRGGLAFAGGHCSDRELP
jgi:hypothetical protein